MLFRRQDTSLLSPPTRSRSLSTRAPWRKATLCAESFVTDSFSHFLETSSEETMKIRLVVAVVGLAISFTLPTFAQQKDTVDPQIAQQIRALAIKFDEAFNRNDAAGVAAFYTEDGVDMLPWGGAFHGRQAIEKGWAGVFQSWHPSNQISKLDRLKAAGNEVRSSGRWSHIIPLTRRAVLLTTAWAALHGLWSVREILGRSAGVPSGTPPVTRQTEKWKCRSTSFGDKQSYDSLSSHREAKWLPGW
jgi:uncharacterized protein (TIGR02246 family)